jgi:predicted amino acid racemase
MVVPRLEIRLDAIEHNARRVVELSASRGISVTGVTKGVCGSVEVASAMLKGGVASLGDSRLMNIRRMREAGLDARFMLLRSPVCSEVEQVVELTDVSLNTEVAVIRLLSECATRRGKVHDVILMMELGDLREGILPSDLCPIAQETMALEGVELTGLGTNLACFAGVKPTAEKMEALCSMALSIERECGITMDIISGGNSANYEWFLSNTRIGRINHLRLGEAILLGCDPLTRCPIDSLRTDAFTLVSEVIELKNKPSLPWGDVFQDAFGRTPSFVDKGTVRRAVLALGEQDTDTLGVQPTIDADILGASSDHMVLDVGDASLQIGSEVELELNYSALLRAMTSPYVTKVYHR